MNRSASPQTIQANRPATHRLHRRSAFALRPSCALSAVSRPKRPEIVTALPESIVRGAGMLELLAAEMRIADLEQALAEARAAALTDPLTAALNRRGFDEACEREWARARRSGNALSIVHIDLDDFKSINDRQGHHAGDRVLVHLVRLLQRLMRPTDVLCRFGGEEFVLLLPETALVDAATAVDRYRREFAASSLDGIDAALSFSAGIVVGRADETPSEAIARADAATYAAKREGKNRIATA